MAYATNEEWLAAQPDMQKVYAEANGDPAAWGQALESWQVQRPGYVDPMAFNNYESYAGAAGIQSGKDEGNDLQNRANFYGLTIENYLNALKTGEGSAGNLTGSQLLSPLERIAAETARAQGIGTMSPEVAALAKANPDVFNAAAQKWSDYFKTTYPGSLEYESVLAGPAKYSATGVTMPTTSPANSMYLLDPTTKQITKNSNYNPTSLSFGSAAGATGAQNNGTAGGINSAASGSTFPGGQTSGLSASTFGASSGTPLFNTDGPYNSDLIKALRATRTSAGNPGFTQYANVANNQASFESPFELDGIYVPDDVNSVTTVPPNVTLPTSDMPPGTGASGDFGVNDFLLDTSSIDNLDAFNSLLNPSPKLPQDTGSTDDIFGLLDYFNGWTGAGGGGGKNVFDETLGVTEF